MKRILIGISIIVIILSVSLTGCGTDTSLDYTEGQTDQLSEYEAMKIRDTLSDHVDVIDQAYSTINAIIFQSDPGKQSLKEGMISSIMKEVKSSTKKLNRMKVPKRIEDIHAVFATKIHLVEDGFDMITLGFKENNTYKIYLGEAEIRSFFDFYNSYTDVIEYMESEDFDSLIVRMRFEIIQKEMELASLKARVSTLTDRSQGTKDTDISPPRDEIGESPAPENHPTQSPDAPEVTDPSPQEVPSDVIPEEYLPYSEYVFPSSSDEILGDFEIENEPLYALNIGKNEIYARHGYVFKDTYLRQFFESKGWYTPDSTFTFDRLNEIEKTNVTLIKHEEDLRTKDEVFYVTSYQEAWEMLTSVVQNYTTPDLSDREYLVIYQEPFYVFSMEYFNDDGVMGDMQYAISAYTGKMYELYSNGELHFFEYAR